MLYYIHLLFFGAVSKIRTQMPELREDVIPNDPALTRVLLGQSVYTLPKEIS